jgi:hypothetical protein
VRKSPEKNKQKPSRNPSGTENPAATSPNYEQLSAIISKYNLSRPRDGLLASEPPAAP